MILLYRLITYLIYLVIYPYAAVKSAGGSNMWRGRLAQANLRQPATLWLHAASAGEVRVISYLLDYLKRRDPSLSAHVTVMTPAGYQIASQVVDPGIGVSFFPLDVPRVVGRTLDALHPKLIVIAETEIWPNLAVEAARRGVPIVQVNGRMTVKSFGKYRLIRGSMRRILSGYERFFLKTKDDLSRFSHFGVGQDRVVVAGDMKFDAPVSERSEARRQQIRSDLGITSEMFLLAAGSTRPGEEEILLDCFVRLIPAFPQLRLCLAPRHVNRVSEVCALVQSTGLRPILHSEHCEQPGNTLLTNTAVIIIDRMGLLAEIYSAADLAFVGGTLQPLGGHNLLEPVWSGTPVLFGPSTGNVRESADYICRGEYGAEVRDGDMLCAFVREIIEGKRRFRRKQDSDAERSATAIAGDYILKRLGHA
ncbi:MAG: glycosyltransferase N-terminal domain-containing protein [Candidatus Zixiibacteriota bacterium]